MLKEIRRISPFRLGIVYSALIGIVYLVMGFLYLLVGGVTGFDEMAMEFGGAGSGEAPSMGMAGAMAATGVLAVVLGSVLGAVVGFLGGVLVAAVYNFVAGLTGGVLVELADPETEVRAR